MRAYARKLGQDEEKWGVAGLIHDFDYEQHPTPEEHPAWGANFLEEHGWPEDIVYAVRAHGDRLGLPRKSLMDKAPYAVEERIFRPSAWTAFGAQDPNEGRLQSLRQLCNPCSTAQVATLGRCMGADWLTFLT